MSQIYKTLIVISSSLSSAFLGLIAGMVFHTYSANYFQQFGTAYLIFSALIEESMRFIGILIMINFISYKLKFHDFAIFGLSFGVVELILRVSLFSDQLDYCISDCDPKIIYAYIIFLVTVLMHVFITIGYYHLLKNNKTSYYVQTVMYATISHALLNSVSIGLLGEEFPIDHFPMGHAFLIFVYVAGILFGWATHQKSTVR